jgi:ribosomal protein L37E
MAYLKEEEDCRAARHSIFYLVYLESYIGVVAIRICADCGFEDIRCTHSVNTWNKEDTHLLCNLCGSDGT